MANKGGVATALWIWNTPILFVNSHLAAHQNETKRRNMGYSNIVGGLQMGSYPGCDILQVFEHIVWMGDLNYRLDFPAEIFGEGANAKTPPKELFAHIKELVARNQTSVLLAQDQLRAACARNESFVGFSEAEITFVPTFKVMRQEGVEYTTQRAPAYCDRILWKSVSYLKVDCSEFWSGASVSSSDHKPVGARITLELRPARPRWWPQIFSKIAVSQRRQRIAVIALIQNDFVPHLRAWKLELKTMRGVNLKAADVSGMSDPFVCFQGDAVMKSKSTEVCSRK